MAQPIESIPGGVRLHLLIQPRASVSEVVGVHDGRVKVRLAAPPVEGAANEVLLRFLSRCLGVPAAAVQLTAGARGRRKTVCVGGVSAQQAGRALLSGHR